MPPELQKVLVTKADLYDDISTRVVLWDGSSSKATAKRLAMKMAEVLRQSKFTVLQTFAGSNTAGVQLHQELQRLTGVAAYMAIDKTSEAARAVSPLATVVQLEQLAVFLERMRAV